MRKLVVLLTGLFAAFLAFLGIVLGFGVALGLSQIQCCQQLPRSARKGHLIVLVAVHLGQRLVGRITERVAPHVENALRRQRGFFAGHLLACQQGQSCLDRQLILAGHAVVAFGLALLRQFRLQVRRHACHMPRTDDFDPRLFERVVDILRLAPRRHAGGMHRIVVMPQAQRERIR